jgi:hypothetical protein
MRTSFRHQSEAQPPNGPLTAATSPDTPSTCPARQSDLCELRRYLESGRSTWISEGTGSRLPACPSANGGRRKTWRLFGPTRRALGRALRLGVRLSLRCRIGIWLMSTKATARPCLPTPASRACLTIRHELPGNNQFIFRRRRIISASAENRGNSCQRKHSAPGTRLGQSCVSQTSQLKTRIVSVARIRLNPWKTVRPFKGICDDISEFESYMPSHAVGLHELTLQSLKPRNGQTPP